MQKKHRNKWGGVRFPAVQEKKKKKMVLTDELKKESTTRPLENKSIEETILGGRI